jgi:hypothetical protein
MKKAFQENLKTAVLADANVVNSNSLITRINHHEDGLWEFFGKKKVNEGEIMVVSLEQIIQRDPSILEMADLPLNFTAFRESNDTPWIIASLS